MGQVTTRRGARPRIAEQASRAAKSAEQSERAAMPPYLRAGNSAAAALFSRVQPKLKVGPAGDQYELEADSVADQVVTVLEARRSATEVDTPQQTSGPHLARLIRRKSTATEPIGAAGGDVDVETERAIQSARSSGGSPLPAPVQASMGHAFGADFSDVRVHANANAARLNDTIQAKAFTLGNDVFFRDSVPDTSTAGGKRLLAHELTHTLQQRGGSVALQRWSLFGKKDAKPKKEDPIDKAKSAEKVEKQRLEGEKAVGTKQREMMTQQYNGDPQALGKLKVQFDEAIAKEAKLKAKLEKAGKTPEEAETEAYKQIWLEAPAGLRALRPMRETRAEKLVAQTAQTRTDVAAEEHGKKAVKDLRGALLSKEIEDLFVKEVELVFEMLKLKVPLDDARQEAFETVWLKATKEQIAKRPARGSKLEAAAYEHAEKRAKRPKAEKSATDVTGKLGLVDDIGGGVAKATGGVGKVTNYFSNDGNKSTLSTGEMAGGGIDGISQMIGGVLSTVSGIADFVELVQDLIERGGDVDYNDITNAISAGLDELKKLDSNVLFAMRTASALNESALASLAGVLPIVSVIANSIGLAANVSELFGTGIRYGVNIGGVYGARLYERPEMVLVQQRLGQRNAQQLEQSIFKTVATATKLGADIAQLASGGMDMGASTGIKTAVIVIEGLHSVAHMIADTVFAMQAKDARKQYFGAHSEGSAEALLRKDAGFAVDALLTAATKGDPYAKDLAVTALKDGYGVKLKTGSTTEIAEARERIFKILGESSDPKTMLDKMKDGVGKLSEKTTAWSDQSANVKTLAEARNKEDGGSRGFGWRMKMWFKSDGAIQRRIAQMNAEKDLKLQTAAEKRMAKFGSKGPDPMISQPQVQQAVIDKMAGMDSKALLAASKDSKYTQFERIVFSQAYAEKVKEEITGEKISQPKAGSKVKSK